MGGNAPAVAFQFRAYGLPPGTAPLDSCLRRNDARGRGGGRLVQGGVVYQALEAAGSAEGAYYGDVEALRDDHLSGG